tara:strand:- start:440 stop:991 length:552 start_codon:yes stop_codon:yes gene_type:complete
MKVKEGDLLLGVDPGYSNLGLAIVQVTKDGPRVVYTTCVTLGKRGDTKGFVKKTQQVIDNICSYPFVAWATEAPPTVPNRVTANLLWYSTGLIWAGVFRHKELLPHLVAPSRIKAHTARILGIKASKHWSPGKELVGQATALLTDQESDKRTNHENDAIMAAISAFLPKEINKAKARWTKQTA